MKEEQVTAAVKVVEPRNLRRAAPAESKKCLLKLPVVKKMLKILKSVFGNWLGKAMYMNQLMFMSFGGLIFQFH
jgi:hypothetical protein